MIFSVRPRLRVKHHAAAAAAAPRGKKGTQTVGGEITDDDSHFMLF